MPQTYEMCVLCGEAITNPLCLTCIENEIEQWMSGINPGLMEEARGITAPFMAHDHGTTRCIVCGRRMSVCGHCYAKEVYGWVKERLPEHAEEFTERFNFELRMPCKF